MHLTCCIVLLAAQGGLYNPVEPDVLPQFLQFFNADEPLESFKETLIRFRTAGMPKVTTTNPFRERYVLVGDRLGKSGAGLDSLQKISLSEYWIRRQKYLEAIELLKGIDDQHDLAFLAQSNLATAWHQFGEGAGSDRGRAYEQAQYVLEKSLKNWPASWEDLTPERRKTLESLGWYQDPYIRFRLADEYYLKLLKLRGREALMRKPGDTIDALFTDVNGAPVVFVNESGVYEPGKLAEKELAKLPFKKVDRAIQIVQQLLVWLPFDVRLYWQLGELYNAKGDTAAARYILNDLVKEMNVSTIPLLKQHRLALNEFQEEPKARTIDEKRLEAKINKFGDDDEPPFNWRILGVGFAVGFLSGMFTLFQLRETRRRMRERG